MDSVTDPTGTQHVAPLAGFAFVEMEGMYDERKGPIIIPKKYRGRRSYVGRVRAVKYREQDSRAWHDIDICGKRVVIAGHSGTRLWPDRTIYRFPVEDIVAAVEDFVELEVDHDAPKRCVHCGAAKSGTSNTILLDPLGFCPRCGKNQDGEARDGTPTVSDAEVAAFHEHMGMN